jgi:hypothetical protein
VLAAEIQVFCGLKSVEWIALSNVAWQLSRLLLRSLCYGFQDVATHEDGVIAINNIDNARRPMAERGSVHPNLALLILDQKLCCDPRDRVYGMLGLVGNSFRSRIHVSYSNNSSEGVLKTFIDFAKACIEEKLPVILERVAGRSRVPGLPSWCPNLESNQGDISSFGGHLRAGVSYNESSRKSFWGRTSPESNKLTITGFCVNVISQVVGETFSWPVEPPGGWAKRFERTSDWEGLCLALAQKALSAPTETVLLGHIYTLSSNTRRRLSGVTDADRRQSYVDNFDNMGKNEYRPPTERRALYQRTWEHIVDACSGRHYFSTEQGRLGLGPLEIKTGDIICVFYGTRTVFVLRPARENPDEWYFVGDAFVHGLMELDETTESAMGADKDFVII